MERPRFIGLYSLIVGDTIYHVDKDLIEANKHDAMVEIANIFDVMYATPKHDRPIVFRQIIRDAERIADAAKRILERGADFATMAKADDILKFSVTLLEKIIYWIDEFCPKDKEYILSEIKNKYALSENKEKTNVQRGRPSKCLFDYINGDATQQEKVLRCLHGAINGQKGKETALAVLLCIEQGIMHKPTYSAMKAEFADMGAPSGYNKYMQDGLNRYTESERKGMIKMLKDILNG